MTLPPLQRKAIDLAYYGQFREFPTVEAVEVESGNIKVFSCTSECNSAWVETTENNYTYQARVINL